MLGIVYRLIVSNLLGNLWLLLTNAFRLMKLPLRPRWVRIKIDHQLRARPATRRWFGAKHSSVEQLHRLVDELVKDRKLQGVVVRVQSAPSGWAVQQSVRELLQRLRAAHKRVVVHLSGGSISEYYIACAADSVVVDEAGPLQLTGVAARSVFWADALGKIGVRAQAEYRGKYKSFAETFTRSDMSEAHREAVDAILDHIDAELREAVAAGRGVDAEQAAAMITGGPYMARAAVDAGLADAVLYWDEVPAWLGDDKTRLATAKRWRRARLRPLRWRPLVPRRKVRVISLHGAIVTGEGAEFPRRLLGSRAAERALDRARKDRRTAAVVLHIDSRGGSAHASDLIWRSVVRLVRKKPVVAYFDNVAASGGYYLACASTKIVAQPLTLTGSIGVVGGKLDLSGLYKKLGLNAVMLTRGEAAAMGYPSRGYSEEERRRLRLEIDALYDQFLRKVAEGRDLSLEQADDVARGRVWVGRDAAERGLVDELGGAERAIELAKELGRKRPGQTLDTVDVAVSPKRTGLLSHRLVAQVALPQLFGDVAELAMLADEGALMVPLYNLYWA